MIIYNLVSIVIWQKFARIYFAIWVVVPARLTLYLNELGLGTLGVRMEKHSSNGLELAEFLQEHKLTKRVNYPGLKTNPYYEIATTQFGNNYGGLLTFELNNKEECFRVINNLELAKKPGQSR